MLLSVCHIRLLCQHDRVHVCSTTFAMRRCFFFSRPDSGSMADDADFDDDDGSHQHIKKGAVEVIQDNDVSSLR